MKYFAKRIFFLAAISWSTCATYNEPDKPQLRGSHTNDETPLVTFNTTQQQGLLCRLTIMHTLYPKDVEVPDEHDDIHCIPIINEQASDFNYPITLPQHFLDEHHDKIHTGTMLISISDANITSHGLQIADDADFQAIIDVPSHLRHLATTTFTTGTKTIAVIRISTIDSSPTYSLSQLKSYIYYGSNTLFKQYKACSFGQLNYVLSRTGFMDFKLQGKRVSDFATPELLVEETQNQLAARYKTASAIADTVVMCLPPGTGTWVGKAPLNHWRAMFNDKWCVSFTSLMHELGHLMGLMHSGRNGNEYADVTGQMSWGLPSPTYPRKCFNGQKSWDLGWYKNRHMQYTPTSTNQRTVNIAAFTDYKLAASTEPVIVKIDEMYLMYNRAQSFNDQTEEKKDQITITKRLSTRSDSLAGLSQGGSYTVANYKGTGKSLIIKVCKRIDRSGRADIMQVSIGLGKALC